MPTEEPLFSIRRRIEFGNCDPAGIVFFVEFYWLCNSAFEAWFDERLGVPFADEFLVRDHMFPVVHNTAEFKKSLRMGDILDITLVLTRLGRSSIDYTCLGTSEGEPVFEIRMVHSIGSRSTRKSIPIPDYLRGPMEAYLAACSAAA